MARYQRIKKVFNLLKPKKEPPTAWDKVYGWMVTRARVIIIVLQVFIAIAFISKVVVDLQARTITEEIKRIDADIAFNFGSVEPRIRTLQQKSGAFVNIWKKSTSYTPVLKEINTYLNVNNPELTVAFSDNTLTITGIANRNQVAEVEQAIKTSSNFLNVELFEIKAEGNEVTQGIGGFGIRATINPTIVRKL